MWIIQVESLFQRIIIPGWIAVLNDILIRVRGRQIAVLGGKLCHIDS